MLLTRGRVLARDWYARTVRWWFLTLFVGGAPLACQAVLILDSAVVTSPAVDGAVDLDARTAFDGGERDVARGPFCTGRPTKSSFCASFDDGNPPAFDWTEGLQVTPNASLVVASDAFSAPGAVAVTGQGGDCLMIATLTTHLSAPTPGAKLQGFHAEFVGCVDAVATSIRFMQAIFEPTPGDGTQWSVDFRAEKESMAETEFLRRRGANDVYAALPRFPRYMPVGKWTTVAIDFALSPPNIQVLLDSVSVSSSRPAIDVKDLAATDVTLVLGVVTDQACDGLSALHFDNVRLEAR